MQMLVSALSEDSNHEKQQYTATFMSESLGSYTYLHTMLAEQPMRYIKVQT